MITLYLLQWHPLFLYIVLWPCGYYYLGAISSWILFYRSAGPPELRDWTDMAESYDNLKNSVSVVIVFDCRFFLWCRISLNEYHYYAG